MRTLDKRDSVPSLAEDLMTAAELLDGKDPEAQRIADRLRILALAAQPNDEDPSS